jgi:flagellar biosynthesis/type III secretory pathway protein FliH
MVHVSQTVNKKAKNYEQEFSPEEQSLLPFLPEFLVDSFKKGKEEGIEVGMEKGIEVGIEKGIEVGMEKGIEVGIEKGIEVGMEKGMEKVLLTYMAKNPTLSNKQIADNFDIEVSLVEQLRKKLK